MWKFCKYLGIMLLLVIPGMILGAMAGAMYLPANGLAWIVERDFENDSYDEDEI